MYKAFTSTLLFLLFMSTAIAQIDTVQMTDDEFVPADITVQVGDTILWLNVGANDHTSTSGTNCMDDGIWDSGNVTPGGGFGLILNTPGDYPYFCIPHCGIGMTGSITVEMASATKTVTVNEIIIHPNPVRDQLLIDFSVFDARKLNLDIINSLGQIVSSNRNMMAVGQQSISVLNLKAGLYFLQIKEGDKVVGTQRFLKMD